MHNQHKQHALHRTSSEGSYRRHNAIKGRQDALDALARARLAWLRHETRIDVQLELAEAA